MTSPSPAQPTAPASVLVLGAAGRTGRLVVAEALAAGHLVTALVRSLSSTGFTSDDRLSVLVGDARRAQDLVAVAEGCDAIVCAVGASGRDPYGLYAQTARAAVTAAAALQIERFVGITSSGVRGRDPHHPWWYRAFLVPVMRKTYQDMADLESTVAGSDLAWTVVRPGRLTDDPPGGAFRVGDGENPDGGVSIPRADLARFVVRALGDDRWLRRYPTLAR